jgi:hypothetical protein
MRFAWGTATQPMQGERTRTHGPGRVYHSLPGLIHIELKPTRLFNAILPARLRHLTRQLPNRQAVDGDGIEAGHPVALRSEQALAKGFSATKMIDSHSSKARKSTHRFGSRKAARELRGSCSAAGC